VPIYATHNAASAAEVRREAYANKISAGGDLLRNFLHMAENETFRRRIVRKIVSENHVRL
jgi:hypothetical protein